jgi:hypothetical protein
MTCSKINVAPNCRARGRAYSKAFWEHLEKSTGTRMRFNSKTTLGIGALAGSVIKDALPLVAVAPPEMSLGLNFIKQVR